MARNYAALPYEYGQEMVALSDAEFGRLCRALIEYSANGTPIALPGNERFYAARVMMQEDRFRTSYDALSEKRKEAGKKGGSKNKQTQANGSKAKQTEANLSKTPYTETETNTDTEVSSNEETKRRNARARFVPPSVQEVAEYCRERGNNVDAEQFVDFYASKGWKVGNATMKDWRAAVRTWEKRETKVQDVKKMPSGKRDNSWMREYG